ncbi:MAG: leucine-rich repeat domain-containing protein [Christensenella sp.]
MKKILLIALTICIVLTIGCVRAPKRERSEEDEEYDLQTAPAEKYTEDGFEYKIVDGEAWITAYDERDINVVVPEYIEGKPVTVICDDAFYQRKKIVSVILPTTLRKLEGAPFYRCYSLKKINIPANVSEIDSNPCFRCYSLEEITVDESNTHYKAIDGVLYSKDGRTLIEYPEGKRDIKYVIPDAVTEIAGSSFGYHCIYLDILVVGENVTKFPDNNEFYTYSPYNVILVVKPNSAAEEYAKKYDVLYRVE